MREGHERGRALGRRDVGDERDRVGADLAGGFLDAPLVATADRDARALRLRGPRRWRTPGRLTTPQLQRACRSIRGPSFRLRCLERWPTTYAASDGCIAGARARDGRRCPRCTCGARLPRRRRPGDRHLPGQGVCIARCCSRARPASARPRWPRCSPAGRAASSCACSATRASTSPRRSTSGTTRASCCTCGPPRRPAGRARRHDRRARGRALLRAVPRAPAAAAGDRPRRGTAARAADRRGRPGRRRVRGLPARDPVRLLDHGSRAGHVPRRRCRRSSSSRRTARATCTTRSSAGASTTGSTIPTSSARSRSFGCAAPQVSETLARQVAAAVESIRGLGLYKPPGRRRDDRLGRGARRARTHDARRAHRSTATLGTVLKYREDQERVRDARHRRARASGRGARRSRR